MHRHQWETKTKNYQPGCAKIEVKGIQAEALTRLVFGQTVVHQECKTCGKARSYTVEGQVI